MRDRLNRIARAGNGLRKDRELGPADATNARAARIREGRLPVPKAERRRSAARAVVISSAVGIMALRLPEVRSGDIVADLGMVAISVAFFTAAAAGTAYCLRKMRAWWTYRNVAMQEATAAHAPLRELGAAEEQRSKLDGAKNQHELVIGEIDGHIAEAIQRAVAQIGADPKLQIYLSKTRR